MNPKLPQGTFRPNIEAIKTISADLKASVGEFGRMLPSSRGGETPNQLQNYRTDIRTYFTMSTAQSQVLYEAQNWVKIKLKLQTAGPVAIGTVAEIVPVLSGKGILLDPDNPFEVYIPKGTQIWISSETINRIDVTIEPVPWLEQIDTDLQQHFGILGKIIDNVGNMIVAALAALQQKRTIQQTDPMAAAATKAAIPQQLPPKLDNVPRLTGIIPPTMIRRR